MNIFLWNESIKDCECNMDISLKNGDEIIFHPRHMLYRFAGRRKTVSTSPLNGGSRMDLNVVFNYDETPPDGGWCQMKAKTYKEHLAVIAKDLGLEAETTSGLSTTVQIENSVVLKEDYHGCEIVVVCTAGADVNACRVGDPSGYDEVTVVPDIQGGTINIFVSCDLDLSNGSLTRGLITITEAKTAALQELVLGSCYSQALATGTGTDGVVLICNPTSDIKLTNTGPHSKLGELIGRLTKEAVKKALYKQTQLDANRQKNVYERMKRFDIDDMFLLISEEKLEASQNVALASLVAHLLDQMQWGLLEPHLVLNMVKDILKLDFDIRESQVSDPHFVKDYVLRGFVQHVLNV